MSSMEFMSCVFMIVVMLYSLVSSEISRSIRIDVWGSRPELGSSQKRKEGFRAIARAMPTRFCIPPLNSLGYLSSAPVTSTLSRQNLALSIFCSLVQSVKNSIGNITLSRTVAKSNMALP